MGGWGEPSAMAAAAVVVPVLLRQFRRLWNQGKFWITVSLLAIIQIPLVIAVRPWIDRYGRISTLLFGIADGLFVIVMIVLVCSKSDRESI
jgi:hypothetical protein